MSTSHPEWDEFIRKLDRKMRNREGDSSLKITSRILAEFYDVDVPRTIMYFAELGIEEDMDVLFHQWMDKEEKQLTKQDEEIIQARLDDVIACL